MRPDHPYFIKDVDNYINHPTGYNMWNGLGSVANHNGPMFRYILEKAINLPEKTIVVSCCSDDSFSIPDDVLKQAKDHDAIVIAPVLCSFGRTMRREYLYIPASDDFFMRSIYDVFAPVRVPWEQRIPKAVWRGGLSGEMLRIDAVKFCMDVPYTEVKLNNGWPRPEYNPEKTPELFAEYMGPEQQCRYKAIFWIDGNCIPSNVLWIFASGSVPVIINETYFWFKDMIKPWVHYVPVKADFSDLADNVRWIFENDDDARKIAENALEFSRTVLSPEGQRTYLDKAIEEHVYRNKMLALSYPAPVERLFPLLTFGGLAYNERYVRKRAALMVESLLNYYNESTRVKEHLDKFFRVVHEINVSNYPDVEEILQDALRLLEKDFPEAQLKK